MEDAIRHKSEYMNVQWMIAFSRSHILMFSVANHVHTLWLEDVFSMTSRPLNINHKIKCRSVLLKVVTFLRIISTRRQPLPPLTTCPYILFLALSQCSRGEVAGSEHARKWTDVPSRLLRMADTQGTSNLKYLYRICTLPADHASFHRHVRPSERRPNWNGHDFWRCEYLLSAIQISRLKTLPMVGSRRARLKERIGLSL